LYSATYADMSSRDALIYKKPVRSEQHDSLWLNGIVGIYYTKTRFILLKLCSFTLIFFCFIVCQFYFTLLFSFSNAVFFKST